MGLRRRHAGQSRSPYRGAPAACGSRSRSAAQTPASAMHRADVEHRRGRTSRRLGRRVGHGPLGPGVILDPCVRQGGRTDPAPLGKPSPTPRSGDRLPPQKRRIGFTDASIRGTFEWTARGVFWRSRSAQCVCQMLPDDDPVVRAHQSRRCRMNSRRGRIAADHGVIGRPTCAEVGWLLDAIRAVPAAHLVP